jgi:hypothetical protein
MATGRCCHSEVVQCLDSATCRTPSHGTKFAMRLRRTAPETMRSGKLAAELTLCTITHCSLTDLRLRVMWT